MGDPLQFESVDVPLIVQFSGAVNRTRPSGAEVPKPSPGLRLFPAAKNWSTSWNPRDPVIETSEIPGRWSRLQV